jgi:type II secretory pathway pseudopilin PulG
MISGISKNRLARRRSRPAGFTLIEIITVLGVVMLLMAIGIGVAKGVFKNVKTKQTTVLINGLTAAVSEYRAAWGDYPQLDNGDDFPLDVLSRKERGGPFLPAGVDRYIEDDTIVDGWHRGLHYEYIDINTLPKIWSNGYDDVSNTADDITNQVDIDY